MKTPDLEHDFEEDEIPWDCDFGDDDLGNYDEAGNSWTGFEDSEAGE